MVAVQALDKQGNIPNTASCLTSGFFSQKVLHSLSSEIQYGTQVLLLRYFVPW